MKSIQYKDESLLLKWLRQCASAIKYLGFKEVIHWDIKPYNIFLTFSEDVKLVDFGLSLTTISNNSYIKLSNARGTATYISPETAENNKYSHKSDIWFVVTIEVPIILNWLLFLALLEWHFKKCQRWSTRSLQKNKAPMKLLKDICELPFQDIPDVFSRKFNNLFKKSLFFLHLISFQLF